MIRTIFRSSEGETFHDLPTDQIKSALAEKGATLWLDVAPVAADTEQIALLFREQFTFHALALDDALQETHVPRVDDWQKYLYIVLHAAGLGSGASLVSHELDIFLGPNFLVTVHEESIPPLDHLWEQCQKQPGLRLASGSDYLLYTLADAVADDYMHVVESLDDEIDRIELTIFRRPRTELVRRIFRVRRTLSRLRRVLSALREVMNRLARDDYTVVDASDRVYFRDVYDHLVRLYDIVEGLRDMAAGALDSYLSVTSNRINEVMRTLTVVNVLFMPLSFLAGFFGMNFFGESFNVANPFSSAALFWLCIGLMAATPLALLGWITRRGMLRSVAAEEPEERKGR
jgi:magnesium transporter